MAPERANDTCLYSGSFPGGFGPLVERLVGRDFGTASVRSLDGSNVRFEAPRSLSPPPYLQGLSRVLASGTAPDLDSACSRILQDARLDRELSLSAAGAERFALRTLDHGKPSPLGARERAALERKIAAATGMRPDSQRPQREFHLILRDDKQCLLTVPLRRSALSVHDKGELPSSTCRLLLELAGTAREDVFLDPFCGSGAIPLERARMGPYGFIFASDSDEAKVSTLSNVLKQADWSRRRRTIFPKCLDARELSRFEDGFCTCIVTDPPWGHWESADAATIVDLYAGFLREANRILRALSPLVLLLGRESPFDEALDSTRELWERESDWPVLVSGRKARVIKLLKKPFRAPEIS